MENTGKTKAKKQVLQSPKGMHDILPQDQPLWDRVYRIARDVSEYYNFKHIETPMVERSELFERSIGEATDIVEKQMFTFKTKSRESLTLRPEGTAGIARSYIQHGLGQLGLPLKLYSAGSMFRYEQPQAGRYREFHQIECDIISVESNPIYDAQAILVFCRILEVLKIKDLRVAVNSIGCKSCRPVYRKKLQAYYKSHKRALCAHCVSRLDKNPLRLLDCKEEKCRALREDAPIMIDNLCKVCREHFKHVLEYLDELELPYMLDHYLVRGLDYYTKTVFEIFTGEETVNALGGGGRYDYLIEMLGGKITPAVGWAMGVERVIEHIKTQGINIGIRAKKKIFIIYIGELAKKKALGLIEELRKNNIDVDESLGRESLNAQLRIADKSGAPLALIFGQKEAFEESIIIRDLATGIQETVPLEKMAASVKKKLKNKG